MTTTTVIIVSGRLSTQHEDQWCKQDQILKTKTKTDFLVSDRSCPKTDGLRPRHWQTLHAVCLKNVPNSV